MQDKVKEPKELVISHFICTNQENWKKYRLTKKEVKQVVSKAKSKTFEDFCKQLDMKVGERDVYKIAKVRGKKDKRYGLVKCIKDEDINILVN